jgi:hypothetical protein
MARCRQGNFVEPSDPFRINVEDIETGNLAGRDTD